MNSKFSLIALFALCISEVKGDWFPTTTLWVISRAPDGIQVQQAIEGTCITTGTYSTGCAAPADATFIPFTPTASLTATPTTPYSGSQVGCVGYCATETCADYAIATNCFCTRAGDIGYCLVKSCTIEYTDATSIAIKLCGNLALPPTYSEY